MHGLGFLGVAYSAIWLGIAGYLLSLGRRQRSLDRRLKDLEGPHGPGQE